jgi:hypothetical protein
MGLIDFILILNAAGGQSSGGSDGDATMGSEDIFMGDESILMGDE